MTLPSRVRIVEVGPRDGLQNEREALSTDQKVALIQDLAAAGLSEIEIGSFVSPRWIPQLSDTEAVAHLLSRALPGGFAGPGLPTFTALVPNEKGMRRALACGIRSIAVFTAASDTFNRKNTNATIDQSLDRFRRVIDLARFTGGIRVRGYVSTGFVCPFEGRIAPEKTIDVSARLFSIGCDEVSIGDTIGVATPRDIEALLDRARADGRLDLSRVALHLHDTRGTALANVLTGLQGGISIFDSAAGGLGGCPYAPGASGNLATEDLVYFLNGMEIESGVDLAKVAAASGRIAPILQHPLPSKVYRALSATCEPMPLGPPPSSPRRRPVQFRRHFGYDHDKNGT